MKKPRVFICRRIMDEGLRLVSEYCQVDLWEAELPPPREVVLERVKGVEGILALLTDKMDGEVMDAAGPQLKVISNYAVGYDNIDVPAATARGIKVGNTPGVLTETTADFAFALLMAAARRIVEGDKFTRAGKWQTWGPTLFLGPDVHGATLGLIGYGRIGRAMAKRAQGFDMRVIYYDRSSTDSEYGAEAVALQTLLREADFVSLHVPLTEETHHLINALRLEMMKETAVLINTARGPIVDHRALYEALTSGKISFAALDVTEPEPIANGDPLLTLDNIIIVPHIASASFATRGRMARIAAENLIAGLKGEVLPFGVNKIF